MTRGPRVRPEKATTLPPAEHAREIALRLLTRAPRSVGQLRQALLEREVSPEVADEVITRYIEVGLLDDAAYAAQIARTRHAERGASARAIGEELRRKGFEPDVIAQALDPIDALAEHDAARALAAKHWARTSDLPHETRVRRLMSHLGRKGYAPSLVFSLVKDLDSADTQTDHYQE